MHIQNNRGKLRPRRFTLPTSKDCDECRELTPDEFQESDRHFRTASEQRPSTHWFAFSMPLHATSNADAIWQSQIGTK